MNRFIFILATFFIIYLSSFGAGVNLGNDTALCSASYYILDAGSGYKSYLWSTGDSSQLIVVTSTGTYGVKVKDHQNKQSSDHVHIVFSDYPTLNLGNDTILCNKKQLKLSAGPSIYTYNWSTGDTSSKLIVSNSGSYSVQVTNQHGCTATDSINIIFSHQPKVSLGNDTVVCEGGALQLNAGSYSAYKWSTGDTLSSITVTQSDKYSVWVKDSAGCITKDKINVIIDTLPQVDLPESSILCNQSSITLSANSYYKSYLWSTGDTNKTIQINKPGICSLNVIDTYGCSSHDSTWVSIDTSMGANLGSNKMLCQGDTLVLDAGSGYIAYLWSNGDTTQYTSINASGSYYVYVKTSNGCIHSDTIGVTYANAEPLKLGSNLFTCLGDSIMLDAGSGYVEYHWSTTDTTQQTYADTAGYYFVVVVDTNGCLNSGLVEVFSNSTLPVNLGPDTCMDEPFRLHAGTNYKSYLWSTAETDSVIIVLNPGMYYIDVVDSSGCASHDSIKVIPCVSHAIDNIIGTTALQVTNPVQNELVIRYDHNLISIEKIEILNALGQVQVTKPIYETGLIQMDTHSLPIGILWLIAYTKQGIISKQIIRI